MDISEGISGTLLAQSTKPPLIFENHPQDGRYKGPLSVSPTITTTSSYLPLVKQEQCFCIAGNAIDREPENGGNGAGYQTDLSYTLNTMDRHAVLLPPTTHAVIGALCAGDEKGAGNQYVDQGKIVIERVGLVRRLTPLECERLQGFPDNWTKTKNNSDNARYKALGNSVAIPCVEYIMHGIAFYIENERTTT